MRANEEEFSSGAGDEDDGGGPQRRRGGGGAGGGEDDEKRLLYVSLSRAKEVLVVTHLEKVRCGAKQCDRYRRGLRCSDLPLVCLLPLFRQDRDHQTRRPSAFLQAVIGLSHQGAGAGAGAGPPIVQVPSSCAAICLAALTYHRPCIFARWASGGESH